MNYKLVFLGLFMVGITIIVTEFPFSSQMDSVRDMSNSCSDGIDTMRGAYLTMRGYCEMADTVMFVTTFVGTSGLILLMGLVIADMIKFVLKVNKLP